MATASEGASTFHRAHCAGTVGVLGSVLAGWFILPGNGFTAAHGFGPLSLGDGPTLRAVAGSVLYLALIALLSLGLATALRDSSAAIAVVLGAWTTAALLHAGVWR